MAEGQDARQREEDRPHAFLAGDAVRAIAAISVVVYHVAVGVRGGLERGVLDALELGLYLFFALSGYVIAAPFVRALLAGRPQPDLAHYARRRLLRIVPAFWLVFVVLLAINGTFDATPMEIAAVFLFAQNYHESAVALLVGPAWTLGIELIFYALVPVAALALASAARRLTGQPRVGPGALLAVISAVFMASLAFRGLAPDDLGWRRSTPAMLAAFMPGVALAVAQATVAPRLAGASMGRWLPMALAVAGAAMLVSYGLLAPLDFPSKPGVRALLLASLGCGALLAAALTHEWCRARAWGPLGAPALQWLGVRSYGVYLIHQGLGITLAIHVLPPTGSFGAGMALHLPVMLVGSIVLADLSYRLVERPCQRFGRRREKGLAVARA